MKTIGYFSILLPNILCGGARRGRDRMVDEFTTATYGITAYHHSCCEFESRIRAMGKTLCDTFCQ